MTFYYACLLSDENKASFLKSLLDAESKREIWQASASHLQIQAVIPDLSEGFRYVENNGGSIAIEPDGGRGGRRSVSF